MLTDIIPASWRKVIYAIFALASTDEGAMLTAYSTIDAATPSWLLIAMSVSVYVGIAVGAVAASNTPTVPAPATPILVPVQVAPVVVTPVDPTPPASALS